MIDGLEIGREASGAPLRRWRQLAKATLPSMIFGAVCLLGLELINNLDSTPLLSSASLRWLDAVVLWSVIALFKWSWLRTLFMEQAGIDRPVAHHPIAFLGFGIISWGLFISLEAPKYLLEVLESFDPIVSEVGDRFIRETSFRTLLLYLVGLGVFCWLRLRLLLWSAEIFAEGRARWPIESWRLTRGKAWQLIGAIIIISVQVSICGSVLFFSVYFFFEKKALLVLLPILGYYFAALDYAYLTIYRQLRQDRNVHEMVVTS